jgi:two-component system, chemotaxis family, protein-glutamate methylesterase/glutaminase
MEAHVINVLIVEDSQAIQEFLVHILTADPQIQVIGVANNGEEALEVVKQKRPDVITMDINMPKMDGFAATRKIMETYPVPTVIVSGSVDVKEVATTFRAIEAGALAIVARPAGIGHTNHAASARELVQMVKLMSEIKVVRRWPRVKREPLIPIPNVQKAPAVVGVVAMGASTGGPIALQTILSGLPKEFSVPMLIVQHIAAGFVHGFADWLAQSTGFPVHVASDGQALLSGHVYVAPDSFHMGVGRGHRITLSQEEPEHGVRPSIDHLFRSMAQVFGPNAIGVLLTGMGKDGAEALKLMKEQGAITLVQDEESSVVPGMPGEAIKLDAATYVLPPDKLAALLAGLVKKI